MKKHLHTLISGSVGRAGLNRKDDVLIVQFLFNLIASSGLVKETGMCSDDLVVRIRNFQLRYLKFPAPDCRIDTHGRTMSGLLEYAARARNGGLKGLAGRPDLLQRVGTFIRAAPHTQLRKQAASRATTKASGGVGKLTEADFTAAAEALKPGVQTAMIRAFAEVESGGKSGFGPSGLPVIAFEGHRFRKYTDRIYDQSHPLLSYPYKKKAGPEWQVNNKDQDTAWKTLKAAMDLDHDAALMSCSWGMFQVMGDNYQMCGYSSVDDFVSKMKASERGQLDAFVGYCIHKKGLRQALADKNFVQCATLYNGDDYGTYDKSIETAFKKYGGK